MIETDRIISASTQGTEEQVDRAIRPKTLADYVGQPKVKDQMDDKLTNRMEAIINSMTPGERERPDIIKGSRKRRIAQGSGTQIQDVNKLLKQFAQMQKMMKKMSGKGGGMRKMMSGMQGMMPGMGGGMPGAGGGAGLPPGLGGFRKK